MYEMFVDKNGYGIMNGARYVTLKFNVLREVKLLQLGSVLKGKYTMALKFLKAISRVPERKKNEQKSIVDERYVGKSNDLESMKI